MLLDTDHQLPAKSPLVDVPSMKGKKRRATFGGREDLAEVYRTAKDLIIKHKLLRIYSVAEIDGVTELTICNLWKICRYPDKSIKLFTFSLLDESWSETKDYQYCPTIPFYPVAKTTSLSWWRPIIESAVWRALYAAGYQTLTLEREELTVKEVKDALEANKTVFENPKMSRATMAGNLISRFIGRSFAEEGKTQWTKGLINEGSMHIALKGLRAVFFTHFYDPDVLRLMLVSDWRFVDFGDYLKHAANRENFLRIGAEHRNLLPLLRRIDTSQWHRKDIFSRKLWVKGDRKGTVVDRKKFRNDFYNTRLRSFDMQGGFRWLSKASPVVVNAWVTIGSCDPLIATNLSLAHVNVRIPVIAYTSFITGYPYRYQIARGTDERFHKLIRLYLIHCSQLWAAESHKAVKDWLRGRESRWDTILDYLVYEGFEQGFPNSQSTWASLVRRSDDWHQRTAIAEMKAAQERQQGMKWESCLPETVVDGIVFTPLLDGYQLAVEGYELTHCVANYSSHCKEGSYRVFSVREQDGTRSTLGLYLRNGSFIIDQHYGSHNNDVCDAVASAGKKLLDLFNDAWKMKNNE